MRLLVAAATDIGQVRERNEDAYLIDEPLFAVADGMGGHRGGEVASSLALETLESLFQRGGGDLAEQVQVANEAVFERSIRDVSVAGMGTTLTAALVQGDRVRLAHVGDSRAYLLRDGGLRQLTEDHTLVHRMVLDGEITEQEAETHPYRSILTRSLGTDTEVEIDRDEVPVLPGDRLLLCTDGLTGMLDRGQLESLVASIDDPGELAERLVRAANRAGGIDNITVVVVDVRADEGTDAEGPEPAGVGTETAIVRTPSAADAEGPAPHRGETPPSTITGVVPTIPDEGRRGDVDRSEARATPPGPSAWGHRWKRVAVWLVAVVALFAVAFVGFRAYLDRQWYVGVVDGHVTVFRGIPASVAGYELHEVVVETTIDARRAESLALYHDLADGITADDRAAAEAIVEQIRRDVALQAPETGGSP